MFIFTYNKLAITMINLSIQDKFDGLNKIGDLRNAIGQEFSYNFSSTCRAKLLSVSEDGNRCTFQEVEAYGRKPKPGVGTAASWLIWNSMFF
jgi:hypothetical protein